MTELIFTFAKAERDSTCDFFEQRGFVSTVLLAYFEDFIWEFLGLLADFCGVQENIASFSPEIYFV
jgi:hypothetical protein